MTLLILLLGIAAGEDCWTLRRVESRLALAEAGLVRVENSLGTVRTRPGNAGEAVLLANVQECEGAARAVVRHEATAGGLRVWVESEGSEEPLPQVDLALRVPADVALHVESDEQLIEIKGHEGAIVTRTTSGETRVAGRGPLDASSETGRVSFALVSPSSVDGSRIETRSGEIVLWLPGGAELVVRASTRGRITTDFSLEIDQSDDSRLKRAVAQIGTSDAVIEVSSEIAAISILRSDP